MTLSVDRALEFAPAAKAAGAASLIAWALASSAAHVAVLAAAVLGFGAAEILPAPVIDAISVEIVTEVPEPAEAPEPEPAVEPAAAVELQPEAAPDLVASAEPLDLVTPVEELGEERPAAGPEADATPVETSVTDLAASEPSSSTPSVDATETTESPQPMPPAKQPADDVLSISPDAPTDGADAIPQPAMRTAAIDAKREAFAETQLATRKQTATQQSAEAKPASASPEGKWETGTHDSTYRLELCGDGTALCGWLTWSRDKSPQAQQYVNQMILDHARRVGKLTWEGSMNIAGNAASGTITLAKPDQLAIKACVMFVICGEFALYRIN